MQLETLSLSSNHLVDLPGSLSRMPAIRNIYANGNALTEIPEELVLSATLQVRFQQLVQGTAPFHAIHVNHRCSTWRTIASAVYQQLCRRIMASAALIKRPD